jgi:DNA ligase-1
LRQWALEVTGIPSWLFEECYETVGDLAETVALLLPPTVEKQTHTFPLHRLVERRLLPLRDLDEAGQKEIVLESWSRLSGPERFIWNKLLTGGFRVGVSQRLVTRALADWSGLDPAVIAHRLMGDWEPGAEYFEQLLSADTTDCEISKPYPFFLAYPLQSSPASLGKRGEWQIEWKWDGIRAQLIKREKKVFLWSRGEELVTERFPEISAAALNLPDGSVLDGELVAWRNETALPFFTLQQRLGRKVVTAKLLEEIPVVLIAFDLLEHESRDLRGAPLIRRREILEQLLGQAVQPVIFPSPLLDGLSWEEIEVRRAKSRELNVEGVMVKSKSSLYGVGRRKGPWWKWKIDPFTSDAVLIYAQRGHGRRASLYSDYTFGVWKEGQLVPFAKAYSGLTDDEIRRVDRFVRSNTLERFGPVRSVKPELVFELAFEGIQKSSRHKSGIAVRFPRMVRWRTDKSPEEADDLQSLKDLLPDEE